MFKFSHDEVIVDVGCFDCQSTMQYFKYGNERYKKIYSFEPEPEQYLKCKNIIEQGHYSNWEIFNYGCVIVMENYILILTVAAAK